MASGSAHSWSPAWWLFGGEKKCDGEREEKVGRLFKTSIRMHLIHNFIYCQNNFLPCLAHGAWLPPYSFFACYLCLGLVFLNVFSLTVTVDRSSPVTIWLLK